MKYKGVRKAYTFLAPLFFIAKVTPQAASESLLCCLP